jgi:hypothetical protein
MKRNFGNYGRRQADRLRQRGRDFVRHIRLIRMVSIGAIVLSGAMFVSTKAAGNTAYNENISGETSQQKPETQGRSELMKISDTTDGSTKSTNSQSTNVSNSSNSQTTVTVNGDTVEVGPNESYENSYSTSGDGSNTDVSISVHNSSSGDENGSGSSTRQQVRLDVRSDSSSATRGSSITRN